jgi:hypothetical protein
VASLPSPVVDLSRYRRQKRGLRPELGLLGMRSNASIVIKAALTASDDPCALFAELSTGSYGDMLVVLATSFEIKEKNSA